MKTMLKCYQTFVNWFERKVFSISLSSQRLKNWHLLLPWLAFTI